VAKRCLVLSNCKAALEEIEREHRGCAPGNDDRHALHSAIIEQLEEIELHGGYTIYLWTSGHAGISPIAVADAIAKKYLKAERDITITRELARTVKACVYIEAKTRELRDRSLYREAKARVKHYIVQQLSGKGGGGHERADGADTVDKRRNEWWGEVITRTGKARRSTREGAEESNKSEAVDSTGERRRLQLTHGMRVGEHKGTEHGENWVRWIRQEKEAIQWGVEGGEAHESGEIGCWHLNCKKEPATSRHVLCVGCAALGDQRGKLLTLEKR
jgi:hypothetical protein